MFRLWIACVVGICLISVAACGETKQPEQPDAPVGPALCTVNTACQLDSTPGLCNTGGLCGLCEGAQDDAKCAAAYGAGNICVQGACVPGQCHVADDCGAGKQCIDNQCVG